MSSIKEQLWGYPLYKFDGRRVFLCAKTQRLFCFGVLLNFLFIFFQVMSWTCLDFHGWHRNHTRSSIGFFAICENSPDAQGFSKFLLQHTFFFQFLSSICSKPLFKVIEIKHLSLQVIFDVLFILSKITKTAVNDLCAERLFFVVLVPKTSPYLYWKLCSTMHLNYEYFTLETKSS